MDSCEVISSFIAELKYDDIPLKTVENTKMFFIDYICSAIAGKKNK